MHKAKTAIMVTGGMDSTTLIYEARRQGLDVTLITVDYGHDAFAKQIEMLTWHMKQLKIPEDRLITIPIRFPEWQREPALFTKGYKPAEDTRPLEEWDQLRYKEFFVEGRNQIMVSYAMAYCSAHKIDELWTGYLYHESEWEKRRSYKLLTGDNSPQFVDMMNLLSQLGFSHQIRIRAPFYENRLSKADVFKLSQKLGVDHDHTHTCYFVPACGKCDNCLLRAELL